MSYSFDLSGKVALVTGASGALGSAFAKTLAANGAAVALAGRRYDALEKLSNEINASGAKTMPIAFDVLDANSINKAFDEIQAELGLVDVVVCNAGVAITKMALDLDLDDWDKLMGTNLTGCWLVAQSAAKRLVQAKKPGSIINISSILGLRVAGAVMPYAVAKAGLEQLTKSLSLEWARHNIRVNSIAPGYVNTPLNSDFFETDAGQAIIKRIPMRRLGQTEDLLAPLLLLASDSSSFMTGSTIVVDGGHVNSTL